MKQIAKFQLNTKQDYLVGLFGIFSILYLLNPTLGIFEFLPDNIPFVGNLDEGAAVFLIIAALKYFGYDVRDVFKKKDDDVDKTAGNEDA